MSRFNTIAEIDVLGYAMKGICEVILKAPYLELDRLNEQYNEIYQFRKDLINKDEAPFDCD